MKARIVSTGEIVDVTPCNSYDINNPMIIWKETFGTRQFATNDIFLVSGNCEDSKPIDWEQRKFEVVKELSTIVFNCPVESHKRRFEDAIKFADMAIEMLKENN